jgi:hypothetical protein
MNRDMIMKEVKNTLLEGMDKSFQNLGFELNKNEIAYQRIKGSSVQTFYFLIFKKKDGIYVEPRWSIKLKEILDIYHKVATKEKKYFKYTPILENSLGELIKYVENGSETGSGISMQYLIENDEDVLTLTKVIPKRFEEYVLPYFDKNSSNEKVDELLNKNPRELCIHQWLYPLRACVGIIAAKLVKNPRYNELLCIYEEELQEAVPAYKEEFERLKLILN